jgi:DNA-binding transcriptional ArsR family regulator
MRALVHPALADITVEGILHALSDPVRASIFMEIAGTGGGQTCSSFLTVRERDIPKSTLSQHFKALREAGLIRSERIGVEMRNSARCVEIQERFPGLLAAIINAMQLQIAECTGLAHQPGKRGLGTLSSSDRIKKSRPRNTTVKATQNAEAI